MIPRKHLDFTWRDLAHALAACTACAQTTPGHVFEKKEIFCLSARSAFDLCLSVAGIEPGSEILVSALTIPDMPRILRAHGFIPVPVDLDPATASVTEASLLRAVTPQTRAILIAHLFGGLADMDTVIRFARSHRLFVIEDCAQAFSGAGFRGNPHSDAVLFSFGPIKTATALGGGVLILNDPEMRERADALHRSWPIQGTSEYAMRLLRFAFFKGLLHRQVYPILVRLIRLFGKDHDEIITGVARSFRNGPFLDRIRRRPCGALVEQVRYRVATYPPQRILQRAALGEAVQKSLHEGQCPGGASLARTHWIFPILVRDPVALQALLFARGIDATRATSSLAPVDAPPGRENLAPLTTLEAFRHLLYLPISLETPTETIEQLVGLVRNACPFAMELPPAKEPPL